MGMCVVGVAEWGMEEGYSYGYVCGGLVGGSQWGVKERCS
jgi:hypothetical protein